ncbi:MAG: hypothetical protein GYA60_01820 [Candidatus Methanofastidiosa archaeon]|nr:hypothetical protein [Candidatus Methanofastidiosa archaeon]
MSNGVNVKDIQSLRRFQRNLSQFNTEFERLTKSLNSNLNVLGESWHDQQYLKFKQEMDQVLRTFQHYQSESQKYTTYLNSKATDLEHYSR